jgi:hypothetical protein
LKARSNKTPFTRLAFGSEIKEEEEEEGEKEK